jgi:CMP-N,N'-diacetyllegionaminic acid synthase
VWSKNESPKLFANELHLIAGNKVVAIVPARGGSKGLPGKNLAPLGGVTLLARTIRAALASHFVDRVVVTTDAADIAREAVANGAEVPFMRPAELAEDGTPSDAVVRHVIEQLGLSEEWLALLQPTSPLRTAEDIDNCLQLASSRPEAHAAVSVQALQKPPHWMFWHNPDGTLAPLVETAERPQRRQDAPAACLLNGAVYVTTVPNFLAAGFQLEGALGHMMPADRSVDIDSAEDLARAEEILRTRDPKIT